MNNKERLLYKIVEVVLACCATEVSDGVMSVTREELLGKCKRTNVVMTRAVLVDQLMSAGYSTTTAAQLLGISEKAVRNLLQVGRNYHETSRAYRIAEAQATLDCRGIECDGL